MSIKLLAARPVAIAAMLLAAACEREGGIESISSAPATSTQCPEGQYLARVCAPQPDGPCGLRCVAPIEGGSP